MDDKLKYILSESAKLMLKYGLRNISMDDISRELGISKKTLYQYVENKTDLIDKVMEAHLEEDWQRIVEAIKPGLNAIDILIGISHRVCEHTKEINPKISFELQKYYPEVFKKFLDTQRSQILQGMKLNIEHGIQEGLYRTDIDPEIVARLYVKNVEEIHNIDTNQNPHLSFDKLMSFMFESHIRGIVNKKGLEYYENHKEKIIKL